MYMFFRESTLLRGKSHENPIRSFLCSNRVSTCSLIVFFLANSLRYFDVSPMNPEDSLLSQNLVNFESPMLFSPVSLTGCCQCLLSRVFTKVTSGISRKSKFYTKMALFSQNFEQFCMFSYYFLYDISYNLAWFPYKFCKPPNKNVTNNKCLWNLGLYFVLKLYKNKRNSNLNPKSIFSYGIRNRKKHSKYTKFRVYEMS